jgi:hypothetical protein
MPLQTLHVDMHLTRQHEIDHLVTIDIGGEAASLNKEAAAALNQASTE